MRQLYTRFLVCFTLFNLASCSLPSNQDQTSKNNSSTVSKSATTEVFSVLFGGTNVGHLNVTKSGNTVKVDFSISNNGRGASSQEHIILSNKGIPTEWSITGKTTFGNEVDEQYTRIGNTATWRSAAGSGTADVSNNPIYIAQNASPYAEYLYIKATLNSSDNSYQALPSGTLTTSVKQTLTLTNQGTKIDATLYALGGIDMDPGYLVLDDNKRLIALASPRVAVVRTGFEHEEKMLRDLTASLNAQRFEDIASRVTHQYEKPVRINNVRIFDPHTLSLSKLSSVVVNNQNIIAIEGVKNKANNNEVTINGNGGTLVAGLYEMHGHMSDNDALLNVLAGVTSVRDMGNEADILESLVDKIDNGVLIGPRITKSGFIEGVSDFSNSTGELAPTKEDAIKLVQNYAARDGYWQIKLYSSMNGDWVPDIAKEAHKLGLRVAGHIPAFSTADQMIEAGYDEITHINQLMLGWVLEPDEDTRTLFRITGMKRFVDLDLNSEKVQHTLDLMVKNNIALDPTTVIHERAMTSRNGTIRKGVLDYIDHMPISVQRRAKVAMLNISDEAEDKAYQQAYDKIIETLALMNSKGILLVPGTDVGGAFEQHRELELFQQFGMSAAEALRRGSYDMAVYLGHGDTRGSIEVGKFADFFLIPGDPTKDIKAIKTISMVATDGKFYFPSEVYPEFGITPFTPIPEVIPVEIKN